MKKVVLDKVEYEVIEDNGDCFNELEMRDKFTDYFYDFDYILGDYAYGKLRLKGFCDKIVLVDLIKDYAEGKAIDLQQGFILYCRKHSEVYTP